MDGVGHRRAHSGRTAQHPHSNGSRRCLCVPPYFTRCWLNLLPAVIHHNLDHQINGDEPAAHQAPAEQCSSVTTQSSNRGRLNCRRPFTSASTMGSRVHHPAGDLQRRRVRHRRHPARAPAPPAQPGRGHHRRCGPARPAQQLRQFGFYNGADVANVGDSASRSVRLSLVPVRPITSAEVVGEVGGGLPRGRAELPQLPGKIGALTGPLRPSAGRQPALPG
jgi:hypothetical protein